MTFTFNVTQFRIDYPQFTDPAVFPDALLQGYFNMATTYISANNFGVLRNAQRYLALNLLTAHLAALAIIIAGGELPNLPQSSTIDKISVSLTPPPVPSEFDWWLNLTAYGQQLLVLLSIASVGGLFFGGGNNRAAFRGASGFRGPWGIC